MHVIPLHQASSYREYQRLSSLPIYSKMSNQDVQDVIDAVVEVVEQSRR